MPSQAPFINLDQPQFPVPPVPVAPPAGCRQAWPGFARVVVLVMLGLLAWLPAQEGVPADGAGPFTVHGTGYDPAAPAPQAIARDGTVASAWQEVGDAEQGLIEARLWSGDTQAGGRGVGGGAAARAGIGLGWFSA